VMSNEAISAQTEERLWKRVANVREVIALIILLCTPVVGFVWKETLRLNDQETAQKQLRKEFDAAKLPEEHERMIRIERDVEWMRKWMEKREK
jgi:hypothetical protein